jgi:hypothetical protein
MTWNPNSCQGGRTPDALTDHQAVGVMHGHYLQVSTRFDTETFEALRARARHEKTSVAEQVRKLVEWGMEAAHA